MARLVAQLRELEEVEVCGFNKDISANLKELGFGASQFAL
jgi:hypothetical protein